MNNKIKKVWVAKDEKVFMKKGTFGWRIVHPNKNEDGSTNWFNTITGGWSNLFRVGIYMVIAGLIYLGFSETLSSCQLLANEYATCCLKEQMIKSPLIMP